MFNGLLDVSRSRNWLAVKDSPGHRPLGSQMGESPGCVLKEERVQSSNCIYVNVLAHI